MSELKLIIDSYYESIRLVQSNTRVKEQVQARAAIMTALRRYKTTIAIADAFGMDHSTVVYHEHNHEANMSSWPGYDDKFFLARRMCNKTLRFKSLEQKLKSIKIEISRLKNLEQRLNEHITEKNQLTDE